MLLESSLGGYALSINATRVLGPLDTGSRDGLRLARLRRSIGQRGRWWADLADQDGRTAAGAVRRIETANRSSDFV
jgi:hypothetical protein